MVEIRKFYLDHVAKMLKLGGESEAAAEEGAAIVMKIETELARISKSRVERRDPEGIYNRLDRKGLTERKGFDWTDYLKRRGLADASAINVTSVPFVDGFSNMASDLSPEEVAILHEVARPQRHRERAQRRVGGARLPARQEALRSGRARSPMEALCRGHGQRAR